MRYAPSNRAISAAINAAQDSLCQSKRGASVFIGDILVSTGYNHKPEGFECDGSDACKANCSKDAIHAEQAALLAAGYSAIDCDMLHVKTVNRELVPSGPPSCLQCSKLLIPAGLNSMWLYHADGWRQYDPHEFHRLSGAYIPPGGAR